MTDRILYHGANGDAILGIMESGAMLPGGGKVYFSKHRWEDSFMHGADTRRKASFVVKVSVSIPSHVVCHDEYTPGVTMTFVVETAVPLRADVLELFVRKPTDGGFETHHIVGVQAIKSYLLQ